jgi:signal transduction histidine kinase
MQQNRSIPDETLAREILPPLLVALMVLAVGAFGLLMLQQYRDGIWPYLLVATLVTTVWLSDQLLRRGRLLAAGTVIAYCLALLPIASIPGYGVAGNNLIFLAVIGVLIAGLLVSPAAPLELANTALASLVLVITVPALFRQPVADLETSLGTIFACGLLFYGTALLSWASANSVHGTIGWAIETATKSERREELLRRAQSDLERIVRERDRLNDQLYRQSIELEAARAQAEAAYRSKASFMATMSHELRTPLNIIIGFSTAMIEHPEMYEGEALPAPMVNDLTEIKRSGEHLLRLINDILDLARVEAGRLDLNKTALPLTPLLDEMLRTAQGLLKERPVLLRREFPSTLPAVLADEVRIRQVLLNLVSNACKFTSVGEVAVGAKADQSELVIWVRDTGIGIAEADQLRIFNQFEQVESHDTRQHTGTGLGLSICRWLVELHGGRMWLESDLGKGSVFSFTLPRVQPSARQLPPVHGLRSERPEWLVRRG